MPKAEFGTPKYVANRMKARGLQKLKWYCQVCEKQCRDENGFKCHNESPSHIRKLKEAKEGGRPGILEYSRQFKHDFVYLLRVSHGEKPIEANKFYNEYIQNKEHIHMTATRWSSLTAFVWHLAREGVCKAEETPQGTIISWINHNSEARQRELETEQQALERSANDEKALKIRLERVRSQEVKSRDSPSPSPPPPTTATATSTANNSPPVKASPVSFSVAKPKESKKILPLKLK